MDGAAHCQPSQRCWRQGLLQPSCVLDNCAARFTLKGHTSPARRRNGNGSVSRQPHYVLHMRGRSQASSLLKNSNKGYSTEFPRLCGCFRLPTASKLVTHDVVVSFLRLGGCVFLDSPVGHHLPVHPLRPYISQVLFPTMPTLLREKLYKTQAQNDNL